jgi:hypothetical protein
MMGDFSEMLINERYRLFILFRLNVTLFQKKKIRGIFVDYQRFALKKYHENITFLSQWHSNFFGIYRMNESQTASQAKN